MPSGERLTFIRRYRALDMAYGEIRTLLQARVEPDTSCESINELIEPTCSMCRSGWPNCGH